MWTKNSVTSAAETVRKTSRGGNLNDKVSERNTARGNDDTRTKAVLARGKKLQSAKNDEAEEPIQVFIWESRPLIRLGIEAMLKIEKSIEIESVTSSLKTLIDRARQPTSSARVVILPEQSFEEIEYKLQHFVLLAENLTASRLGYLIGEEANAIISIDEPRVGIISAIQAAVGRNLYISSRFTSALRTLLQLAPQTDSKPTQATFSLLTASELRVLDALLTGATNRQIAQTLNITERTVKFHVSNILTKTNFANRARLIASIGSTKLPTTRLQPSNQCRTGIGMLDEIQRKQM